MQVRLLRPALGMTAWGALALIACSESRPSEPHQHSSESVAGWIGPQFPGAGVSGLGQSIAAGLPALSCGDPTSFSFTRGPAPGSLSHLSCFYDRNDQPAASVEWIVESAADGDLIHVRLTLNPEFVDNTYGANCIGWPAKGGPAGKMPGKMMPPGMGAPMPRGGPGGMPGMAPPPPPAMAAGPAGPNDMAAHSFRDLTGSDHAEFKLSDANGELILHFKEDYISQSSDAPSGYATLGVSGGDGRMIAGDEGALVAFSTSLDRDLNACGLADFTLDSPATDLDYTPVKGAEAWDYRVVYDVWVAADAFGDAGFGEAVVDFVHASPSKAEGPTSIVTRRVCPPSWKRYCNDPNGCDDNRCGDAPDEFCTDGSVPGGPVDAGTQADPV